MRKEKRSKQVVLIDGRNWVYRHGYTRIGLSSRGRPTGAIYGSIQGLITLNRMYPDASIVFCWDGKNAHESWRHRVCETYKSNRVVKSGKINPLVSAIREQIPIIVSFLRTFGLKQFSVDNLEADDLIGVLSTHLKASYDKVIIYSSDRDFYQLIHNNVVVVGGLDKKKGLELRNKDIVRDYGVKPADWLKYRAFVGDAGDRIDKPIRGIGPSKALAILAKGVDASKKKPHKDYKKEWKAIRLAYKLSRIIRTWDDRKLPGKTQNDLRIIIDSCVKSLFRSKKIARSSKSYKEVLKFLAEFELEELIRQRSQLWEIR